MKLQDVLEIFRDGDWHSLPEVAKQLNLDNEKAISVFSFLAEYNFITIGKSGLNGRIAARVKKFLEQIESL
ncbi:hypothetical protein ES703_98257 [subsurface metagenome]